MTLCGFLRFELIMNSRCFVSALTRGHPPRHLVTVNILPQFKLGVAIPPEIEFGGLLELRVLRDARF